MEFEMADLPPIGKLEAFLIAGSASTAPWSFQGKLPRPVSTPTPLRCST